MSRRACLSHVLRIYFVVLKNIHIHCQYSDFSVIFYRNPFIITDSPSLSFLDIETTGDLSFKSRHQAYFVFSSIH